jgi:hypothetical protein
MRVYDYWRNVDQELGERIQLAAEADAGTEHYPGAEEPAAVPQGMREEAGDTYAGHR